MISYLKKDFNAFLLENSVSEVQEVLKSVDFTHIVVVDNSGFFVGMLSCQAFKNAKKTAVLSDFLYDFEYFRAKLSFNWEEIIEKFTQNDANIIAVTDENNHYLGYFEFSDFVHFISQTPFFKEKGSFIVLEKDRFSYSFSEISQVVEMHNATLLGVFISEKSADSVQITLKVATDVISEILQTFRRYGYAILLEKHNDLYLQELKQSSDYFEKFISF